MRILDVYGFDAIPVGSLSAPGTNTMIPGTRLRNIGVGYVGTGNSPYCSKATDALRIGSSGGIVSGNGGHAHYAYAAAYFADIDPNLLNTNTPVTMGVRHVVASMGNVAGAGIQFCGLVFENVVGNNLIRAADCAAVPAIGLGHYWEMVVDRAKNSVAVFRDNKFLKTVDISGMVATNGKVIGFLFSYVGYTANYGGGSCAIDYRDMYMAEVEAGDISGRLGPVVVKRLPVSAVDAAWATNPAASVRENVINDNQPNMSIPSTGALFTYLAVTDVDPKGVISFSTDNLLDTDRVSAVVFQIDALAAAGSSVLDATLINGATEESTKKLTYGTAYNRGVIPGDSNWAKLAHLKQYPSGGVGKAVVGNLKIKLKASA